MYLLVKSHFHFPFDCNHSYNCNPFELPQTASHVCELPNHGGEITHVWKQNSGIYPAASFDIKHWVSALRNEQTPCAVFKCHGRAWEIAYLRGIKRLADCSHIESWPCISILPATKIYHLGISRDKETLQPTVYLNKLPEKLPEGARVFVVDPAFATGGTIIAALELIKGCRVDNNQIKVISALAAPPALRKLAEKFPGLHVYSGILDPTLNDKGYIIPGLGDAGDRCFGT